MSRPTATYPTADHLARREREEAAHRERLADLRADRTPTEELPVVTPSQREQAAPHVTTNASRNEGPIQDMWRPRWMPAWHPSPMQLAIGAAVVLIAITGACRLAAEGMADAAHRCHELAAQDRDRAERECRPAGSGTTRPGQHTSSPHTPSFTPSQAPSPSTPPALTRVTSSSPSTRPSPASPTSPAAPVASTSTSTWVTQDTRAPYDRTDAAASPLDLPRCTTSPSTPLPCLASLSSDGSRAVVLEEDASLTGLVRR